MTSSDNILVQFLFFDECPRAAAARESLEEALSECGLSGYEEIDISDPSTPGDLRGWGSPTILINGCDVTGEPKSDDPGCRSYAEGEPSAIRIATAINLMRRSLRAGF